jgi:hypothetical protein
VRTHRVLENTSPLPRLQALIMQIAKNEVKRQSPEVTGDARAS